MKTYKINVIEHGEQVLEIESESESEAIAKAQEMVEDNGEVIFDGSTCNCWWNYELMDDTVI